MTPSENTPDVDVHEEPESLPEITEPATDPHADGYSCVESVVLHLVSEHEVVGALHLDHNEAGLLHEEIHEDGDHGHERAALTFRVGRALDLVHAQYEQEDEPVLDVTEPPTQTSTP